MTRNGDETVSDTRAYRARSLRYKRAALASMGFDHIWSELNEMCETCSTIHWWTDQDDETLLNALDGDDEDVWEFKMAFADLKQSMIWSGTMKILDRPTMIVPWL